MTAKATLAEDAALSALRALADFLGDDGGPLAEQCDPGSRATRDSRQFWGVMQEFYGLAADAINSVADVYSGHATGHTRRRTRAA